MTARGPAVTTREIARAAGVAEGTIFGVFPDKESLVRAVVDAAFDPAPAVATLEAITQGSLEDEVAEAVEILRARLQSVFGLMSSFGYRRPEDADPDRPVPPTAIVDALTRLFERHEPVLRKSPVECANLLRLFVFAASHPLITDGKPLPVSEIVDVLLGGVARPRSDDTSAPALTRGDRRC
jgi:AcrR family transcriptional regulator